MSLALTSLIRLLSPKKYTAGLIVLAISIVGNRCYGVDALVSSWEGTGSESDGTEFIYDTSGNGPGIDNTVTPTPGTPKSFPENVHYYDGWFPYGVGNGGADNISPFGNTDLRTYSSTSGVTKGTKALEISKNSTYWDLQRNFGGAQAALLARASSVKLDLTFDQSLLRNFTPDAGSDNGFSNFTISFNSPLGYVDIPRTKTFLDTTTFTNKPTGNQDIVGPNANAGYAMNPNVGEYDYYAATGASNPVELHQVSLNLYQHDFKVAGAPAPYSSYNGMNYMDAIRQITQNGTNIPTGFYMQLNIAIQSANGPYFPNSGDTSTPDGYAVSYLIDNFRVQSNIYGDFDQNGILDNGDIQAGLNALINKTSYENTNDMTDTDLSHFGDVNGDGVFDVRDIRALMVNLTTGGGGSLTPVPEPASFVLLGLAGALCVIRQYRGRRHLNG